MEIAPARSSLRAQAPLVIASAATQTSSERDCRVAPLFAMTVLLDGIDPPHRCRLRITKVALVSDVSQADPTVCLWRANSRNGGINRGAQISGKHLFDIGQMPSSVSTGEILFRSHDLASELA